MGPPTPVAIAVDAPELGKVVVDASDGVRYYADLTTFTSISCYPRTEADWRRVQPDSYGLTLIWTTRFEVHMDQVVSLADETTVLRS